MNCVVCNKPLATCEEPTRQCYTCSPSCAGVLAHSQREANILRSQFDNPEKNEIRQKLLKYILRMGRPYHSCKEPMPQCLSILDFWGGGLFSDLVINHYKTVKNHNCLVLYEVDNNPKLFPALKKYAIEKNQFCRVKNQYRVVPFCGSLADFVRQVFVRNQNASDLIWLDYCGTVKEDDIIAIKPLVKERTILALTSFIAVNSNWYKIAYRKDKSDIERMINKHLPQLSLKEEPLNYKKEMALYIFKQKYEFPRKEVYYEATALNPGRSYANFKIP